MRSPQVSSDPDEDCQSEKPCQVLDHQFDVHSEIENSCLINHSGPYTDRHLLYYAAKKYSLFSEISQIKTT